MNLDIKLYIRLINKFEYLVNIQIQIQIQDIWFFYSDGVNPSPSKRLKWPPSKWVDFVHV